MKKLLIFGFMGISIFLFYNLQYSKSEASSFGEPENSRVLAEAVKASGGSYNLSFKLALNDGIALNMEGPWKFTIKAHEGLVLSQTEFTGKELNQAVPGYAVQSTGVPSTPKGKVDYTLIAFICTKDKTRCFREVHNGSLAWGAKN